MNTTIHDAAVGAALRLVTAQPATPEPAGEASATTREAATGELLNEIAGRLVTVVTLARAAMDQDADTQCATLEALATVAASLGQLADRTARAINGGHGVQSDDEWLLSFSALDALQALERQSASPPS